jgi:hypothetical protein
MADLGELVDRLLRWFTVRTWTAEPDPLYEPPPLPREPSTGLRLVFLAGFAVIAAGAVCLYLSDAVATAGSWSQATLDAFGVGLVVGGLIDVLAIFGLNQVLSREQKHRELRSQAEAILHDDWASPQERSDAAGEFLRRNEKQLDMITVNRLMEISSAASPGHHLTPASPADLPPLGKLITDNPRWQYKTHSSLLGLRSGVTGVTHLRVWATATDPPGQLAVVTKYSGVLTMGGLTEERIRATLARKYKGSLVLLEHYAAAGYARSDQILDLVSVDGDRRGAGGVWPTPEEDPGHARLELWMAAYGHQILRMPASAFRSRQDEDVT